MKTRIVIPRELLLVEIERRCPDSLCNARLHIGLTKEEARAYRGFECDRCERMWDDELSERDVPEWWDELRITDPATIRETPNAESSDPSEGVTRLSENSRRTQDKARTGDD